MAESSGYDPATVNDLDLSLPSELEKLSILLDVLPETLASGNPEIQSAALDAAKYIFDLSVESESSSRPHVVDLVSSLAPSLAPQTRSKAKSGGERPLEDLKKDFFAFTPLKSLFVDGMDDEQIWAQLDLRTQSICRMLDFVLEGETGSGKAIDEGDTEESDESDGDDERLRQVLEALKEGDGDLDMEDFMAKYGIEEDELDDSQEGEFEEEEDSDGQEEEEGMDEDEGEEDIAPLRDPSSDEDDFGGNKFSRGKTSKKRKRGEASELDDGFFDLAEFNAYSERAESKSSSKGKLAGDDDSDDSEEAIDFFASIDPREDLDDDDDDDDNQELFYQDFFEAPRGHTVPKSSKASNDSNKKSQVRFQENVRVKKITATGRNRSLHDDDSDGDEEDEDYILDDQGNDEDDYNYSSLVDGEYFDGLRREETDSSDQDSDVDDASEQSLDGGVAEDAAIQRSKRDLFDDEDDDEEKDMTTHQRRMAALQEQISELESENVAPKEWMLLGEAASKQRPQNSLLEEDVDFERVRKAVPIITEEVVQNLEETIKARILEGRFDDVVRIRPLEDKPFLPSRFFELQDSKSTQSLAQIYENDYLTSQSSGSLPDDRDGKLKKEHDEINALWEKISGKLDALSNAHFVPKQPKATISTVTNAPAISMESALPTSKSATSMLAPEEVFSSSPSALKARSELTPAEKRTQRTKERKLKKRQRDALEKSVDKFSKSKGVGGVKKQKQAALDSLVKRGKGVTVVGKERAPQRKLKKK